MKPKKAVVIGYDAISCLGPDLDLQWEKAAAGKSGIGHLTRFPMDPDFPVRIAGQVAEPDLSPYPFLSPRALALWPSPIYKYAMLTVHRALERSGIEITKEIAHRVAITFSTAVGGQDALIGADRRMVSEKKLPPPYANPNSCINMVGGRISVMTGATGPISAPITACATGATSMIVGDMLLAQGKADICICGAVDFPLVEPIVAGFATMNAAYRSNADDVPERASRPFSRDRKGFVISEGGAAIILATPEFARAHGLSPEFGIAGWSMTSDAFHFVAPNPETVTRCVAEAIEDAGLSPSDIDAVNAHGTSTKIGDKAEYDALRAVFGSKIPPVSANKSQIGHAMGGASAIETVYAMEGMRRGMLLPTINYTPAPEMEMDCVSSGERTLPQEFVLKNAFGFGGCNACIVMGRIG